MAGNVPQPECVALHRELPPTGPRHLARPSQSGGVCPRVRGRGASCRLEVRLGLLGTTPEGEPFLVPLAIPLIAGPSAMATACSTQRTTVS